MQRKKIDLLRDLFLIFLPISYQMMKPSTHNVPKIYKIASNNYDE